MEKIDKEQLFYPLKNVNNRYQNKLTSGRFSTSKRMLHFMKSTIGLQNSLTQDTAHAKKMYGFRKGLYKLI